ncbi:hypothetical protein BDW22DRAFT_1335403 [Trametopsis cervina]|nr:hypothetical protein BDW22DRAFT_1335403 [Trametopsis cervina]
MELNGLPEHLALKVFINFLSGKARKFFMAHVAIRQNGLMISTLYEALFPYCFLEDYKLRLQNRLMHSIQSSRTVWDFAHDLKRLAD